MVEKSVEVRRRPHSDGTVVSLSFGCQLLAWLGHTLKGTGVIIIHLLPEQQVARWEVWKGWHESHGTREGGREESG